MFINKIFFQLFIILLFVSAGCANQSTLQRATLDGFEKKLYPTHTFLLTIYQRINSHKGVAHIYIEGDGQSWKTRYQLSTNPTPKQPLALELALADRFANVIYVARPCQYTPHSLDKECVPKFWSSHRYAPEVIKAFHEVIDEFKKRYAYSEFVLIGFSGGASIAALLAQQRNDIKGLISVSGDLNHERLNKFHGTTALTGSLNPFLNADKLSNVPQRHYIGDKDKIIPLFLSQEFTQKMSHPRCWEIEVIPDATHHSPWKKIWPTLISKPLACR